MKVLDEHPPNYEDILQVIPEASRPGVIFTYGDILYAPGVKHIPTPLMIHEEVHSRRQGTTEKTVQRWWREYLNSIEYRFHEELLAHRAEWQEYRRIHSDRNLLARAYHLISLRLASPLYGSLISYTEARKALLNQRYVLNA